MIPFIWYSGKDTTVEIAYRTRTVFAKSLGQKKNWLQRDISIFRGE